MRGGFQPGISPSTESVITRDYQTLQDIPSVQVDQIVIFGNASFTTPAIRFVLDKGIDVAYLSSRGTYRGRLQPEWTKDAALRHEQYRRASEGDFCLRLAQQLVSGKIQNMVAFCRRQRRLSEASRQRLDTMGDLRGKVAAAQQIDQAMGYEGLATAAYFSVFRTFLQHDLGFQGRHAHPPTDPVNALLSLGYTLLYNHLYAAVNIVGLDPSQGFSTSSSVGMPR